MGYVPEDAEWYIAELVEELTVAGDDRNMVWRNLTLIRASSPEDAYEKATSLGAESETEYLNSGENLVTVRFRGISFLDVIHDSLEHGAELLFHSQVAVPAKEIEKLVRRKEELAVFQPPQSLDGPDVSSSEVLELVRERLSVERPGRT